MALICIKSDNKMFSADADQFASICKEDVYQILDVHDSKNTKNNFGKD